MNEPERVEDLVSRMMSSAPQPKLSAHFTERLTKRVSQRLVRRNLNSTDRRVIYVYIVVAMLGSVYWMRSESIPWLLIVASIGLPLMLVAIIRRWLR